MSEEDKHFNFMSGLQGWAQTKLRRQGIHDLPTTMATVDCLVDYKMGGAISTMHKPKSEGSKKAKAESKTSKKSGWKKQNKKGATKVKAMVDNGATHNFVVTREATELGLKLEKDTSQIKAINSKAQKIQGVAKNVPVQVGGWKGMCSLLCVPLDDFDLILGVDFLLKAKMALIKHLGGLMVLEEIKEGIEAGLGYICCSFDQDQGGLVRGREEGVGDLKGHQGQALTALRRQHGIALGVPRTHRRHSSTHTWAPRHVWHAPRGRNGIGHGVAYLFLALARGCLKTV
ncbi:hypothetical protein CK203_046111 [Vitis vinifera]|uniref:Aspartic peptidase DDI1-type domain-containing protein n=1 Tax=Vitis vinifera TaxID=29760 RepID=A0A438HP15_VITVI|nr:hypothetical protein CK203_046111 [Vitis vinifera]